MGDAKSDSTDDSEDNTMLQDLTRDGESRNGKTKPLDVHSFSATEDDDDNEEASDIAVTAVTTPPAAALDKDITEATPATTRPPSNSGGSRKRGAATAARATSSSKKKKTSARCWKGARVKVTRSHLFHTHEHQNQRTNLKDMATASTSSEESHPGLESKGMQFALMLCLRAIKMC
jgi:hypothetical protein